VSENAVPPETALPDPPLGPPRRALSRASVVVHGGRGAGAVGDPVVTPLSQSVTYRMAAGPDAEMQYTGSGNTPNLQLLQRRLALLEGTDSAMVLSSGTAATVCTMLALLRSGDHLVASHWLYGGTQQFLERELRGFGVDVTFVDPCETRSWRRALRRNTRVLFVETPVNPTTRLVDLSAPRTIAQEGGIALVVDSTFATPINFRPVEHGADVVMHSATKFLNGHHDVLAGVVCGSEAVVDEVRAKMQLWGHAPDPFALWLLERGLKTLDVRMQRQNSNALQIAQWASSQQAFRRVLYPGLASHPDHALAREVLDGFGSMLIVELAGGPNAASQAVARLGVFMHAPSLGGVDSLVCEPRFTSHRHLTSAQREALGIPDGSLRLSVGVEDAGDLIADLAQAVA